jgi:carbonic anhydrase
MTDQAETKSVPDDDRVSRRSLLGVSAAGIGRAAAVPLLGLSAAAPKAMADGNGGDQPTPPQALTMLKEGNARFVAWRVGRGELENVHESALDICIPGSDQNFENAQSPFAIVLGCSDSRVPPELIFDQGFGDIFTTRTAGATCDPIVLGTIEYAAVELGSPLLVVMGHSHCGAVTSAVDSVVYGTVPPGWIQNAITPILPAARQANREMPRASVDAKIARAVRIQAANVSQQILGRSVWLRQASQQGRFGVVPAVYDLDTGIVTFLG